MKTGLKDEHLRCKILYNSDSVTGMTVTLVTCVGVLGVEGLLYTVGMQLVFVQHKRFTNIVNLETKS